MANPNSERETALTTVFGICLSLCLLIVAPSLVFAKVYYAPDFTLPVVNSNGLTGQQVTLSSLRGKVVLLEFMEPWCSHCENMAPVLESLYQQYGAQNVVFLSVAGSWDGATADDAAKFIRDHHSNLTYVYDSSGTTFSAYGVTGTPTFFIIGKDGTVSNAFEGEVLGATLANALSIAIPEFPTTPITLFMVIGLMLLVTTKRFAAPFHTKRQ